jgi:hypothetical protein
MGRRSRKRGVIGAVAPAETADAADAAPAPEPGPRRPVHPATRRARLDEAPQPPWAPVPLTEITILAGLVLLGVAVLGGGGPWALAFGLALVTLATLEVTLREHLAGYRSHSALLAGAVAIVAGAGLALAVRPAKAVVVVVAGLVFLLAFQVLRRLFQARSGGLGWRA